MVGFRNGRVTAEVGAARNIGRTEPCASYSVPENNFLSAKKTISHLPGSPGFGRLNGIVVDTHNEVSERDCFRNVPSGRIHMPQRQ